MYLLEGKYTSSLSNFKKDKKSKKKYFFFKCKSFFRNLICIKLHLTISNQYSPEK